MADFASTTGKRTNGPDVLQSGLCDPAEAWLRESSGVTEGAAVWLTTAHEQPTASTDAPADPAEATAPRSTFADHALTKLLPEMPGPQLAALVADIAKHGLREPIVLLNGEILDGRARYRACITAGVTPRFKRYGGDDPPSYVISANLQRRHLTESQRAMVAAKFATMRQGARTDLAHSCARSQSESADLLNVGRRLVQSAQIIYKEGHPELVRRVEGGEIKVSPAASFARMPMAQQADLVRLDTGALRGVLKVAKSAEATDLNVVAPVSGHNFSPDRSGLADGEALATRDGVRVGTDGTTNGKEIACSYRPLDTIGNIRCVLAAASSAIEKLRANTVDAPRCEEINSQCTEAQRLLAEACGLLGTGAAAHDDSPAEARGAVPIDILTAYPRRFDATSSSPRQSDKIDGRDSDALPGQESVGPGEGGWLCERNADSIEPTLPRNRGAKSGVWDGTWEQIERRNQILACAGPKAFGPPFGPLGNMSAQSTLLDPIGSAPATLARIAATTRRPRRISMERCRHEAGHAMAHWFTGIRFTLVTSTVVSGFELPLSHEEARASEAAGDVGAIGRARTFTEILMFCCYAGPVAQARCPDRRASCRRGAASVARRSRVDEILAYDGQWDLEFAIGCAGHWARGVAMAVSARRLAKAFVFAPPVWRAIREIARRLHAGETLSFEVVDQIARQHLCVDAAPTRDKWVQHWPPSAESVRRAYLPFHQHESATDGLALFDAVRPTSEFQPTTDSTPNPANRSRCFVGGLTVC